jgi:hypothetical protein
MSLGIASIKDKEGIARREQVSTNVAKTASATADASPAYGRGGADNSKSPNIDSEIQLSRIGGLHKPCKATVHGG